MPWCHVVTGVGLWLWDDQTHGDDELMIDRRKSCDHKHRDFRGKNGNKNRKHEVEWLPGGCLLVVGEPEAETIGRAARSTRG